MTMTDTQFAHVPLDKITNDGNVRSDLGDLDSLTHSIKLHGIIEPLIVTTTDTDGAYRLICGQRRLAAATSLALATVPAVIRPDLADVVPTLAAQIVENEQRRQLTTGERVAAYQQLNMAGLSQAAVAEQTASKPADVKRLLAVAKSETATDAVTRHPEMSLEHAVILAEFDADKEATVELLDCLEKRPGYWDHAVSRLRQDRKDAKEAAKRVVELKKAGTVTFESEDEIPDGARRLYDVVGADGKLIDREDHDKCPGHAVLVDRGWGAREVVYCTDWEAQGHKIPSWASGGSKSSAKTAEQKSEERKQVLANNKAWRAAEPVRRKFVREMLTARKLPEGGLRFAVADAVDDSASLTSFDSEAMFAELYGVETTTRNAHPRVRTERKAAVEATEARLGHVLLAKVAAAHEVRMDVNVWRNRNEWQASWLTFLASAGYTLSDVEQIVVKTAAKKGAVR